MLTKALTTPKLYKQQIYRLQQQMQPGRKTIGEIDFTTLSLQSNKVARLIANSIKYQSYQNSPVIERRIKVKEKFRLICKLDLFDHVVQSAICQAIMPYLKNYLTTSVYSYRSRSNYTAARSFAKFIKKSTTNKLDLYVIRTDIKSYTDSIPVDDQSPLWPMLKHLLQWLKIEEKFQNFLFELIKKFLRPVITQEGGENYQRLKGLPMGAPLGAIVSLIYLNETDRILASQPGTFYARYGDDILIAHKEIANIEQINKKLLTQLNHLSLKINPKKHRILYLNKAGRPATKINFSHSQKVTYLGFDINANGSIGIKTKSQSAFLNDITQRIYNLNKLYHNKSFEEKGRAICKTLNQCLSTHHSLAAEKVAILTTTITDRKQLIRLDYLIALKIACILTGTRGVRAWRKISYQKIRSDWGLNSLCVKRNNYGKNTKLDRKRKKKDD